MVFGAIIGAGASLLGGALSSSSNDDAAQRAEFQPFGVTSQFGGVTSNDTGIQLHDSPFSGQARDFFENQFNNAANDSTGLGAFGQNILGQGQAQFGSAFEAAQAANFANSNLATDQFLAQNQALRGQLGSQGTQGVNQALGGPTNAGGINAANQTAQGFLNQLGSVDQLAGQVTSRLDALAGPQEQQAVNAKFNNLFGTGRLGNTGGQQDLGQLALAQSQAQDARGLAGLNFAQAQQAQLGQQAGSFLGLGGQLTQADQQFGLGQGQIGQNLLGQVGGLQSNALGASTGADARNIQLQNDRLSRTQDLFGFGQQLQEAPTGQASRALLAQDPLNTNALNVANLSLQGSSIATGGGGNAAQIAASGGSPFGGALQGFGQGLFESSGGFGNLFGNNQTELPQGTRPETDTGNF